MTLRLSELDNRGWRKLYGTSRWKRRRAAQLNEQPLCERCLLQEIITEATVVHHAIPHKGDLELFWGGPFESLCKPHHDSQGQQEDNGKTTIQFDAEGWPIYNA